MEFKKKLASGRLLRRYKRFLADIELSDGSILTVHCPNTGAMTGCAIPGSRVYFSDSESATRKYPHTLEWVQVAENHRACINTNLPNRIIREGIESGALKELQGYAQIRNEVRYGLQNSRIDLLLEQNQEGLPDCYVEVKNATLVEGAVGYFPDAVSKRALRHIEELMVMVDAGYRAALVFCANHTAMEELRPADKVDVDYGKLLRAAAARGVELLAYKTEFDENQIKLIRAIPVVLDG